MAKRLAYSLKEFSELMGISHKTIIRRINDPNDPLPTRRFGKSGKYMIFMADFEKWLDRQPSNY